MYHYHRFTQLGTPHTHHYALVKLALNNGKHILVEKPATINAAELRDLAALAKEKKLFLMEAMWTRFLPVAKKVSDVLRSGELGDVRMVYVFS